jgi:hypothetical protein
MFMDFFATFGRFPPRGRGQSYKIWAKSVYYFYVCKITILQNSNFCEMTMIHRKNLNFHI